MEHAVKYELSLLIMTEANNNPDCVPEHVKQTARELAEFIIHHIVGTRKRKAPSKHAETLQRTTEEMYHRHEILFNSMAQKLDVVKDNAPATFKNVADEIFVDGKYNWGRVVSVYAFGACLAVHCYNAPTNNKDDSVVKRIATVVGNYVATNLSGWIHANGGWVSMCLYSCVIIGVIYTHMWDVIISQTCICVTILINLKILEKKISVLFYKKFLC